MKKTKARNAECTQTPYGLDYFFRMVPSRHVTPDNKQRIYNDSKMITKHEKNCRGGGEMLGY